MKARIDEGEGFWLRAEKQSGGKGRMGRQWESPVGNLYCSTIVDLHPADPPPSSLSFAAALAVHDALRLYLPHAQVMLKWPNDILVSDAKICGILLERTGDAVVVGIGVNIAVVPSISNRKVTSMHIEGAETSLTAEAFLDELAPIFAVSIDEWRSEGMSSLLERWQNKAHPVGIALSVSQPDGTKISGEYRGLTSDGALRLRKPDGALIAIHAGDITVGQKDIG